MGKQRESKAKHFHEFTSLRKRFARIAIEKVKENHHTEGYSPPRSSKGMCVSNVPSLNKLLQLSFVAGPTAISHPICVQLGRPLFYLPFFSGNVFHNLVQVVLL